MIQSYEKVDRDSKPETKDRILDAAERLFAEHGFDATSLRMITTAAGVNLAAVNYHFRSKDSLIEAVFGRRIGPVNKERLEMLTAAERAAGSGPLSLEAVVRAFVEPVVRIRSARGRHGDEIGRLFGRIYSDPCEAARNSFFGHMREILRPFTSAFRRALPDLPMVELLWKIHFGVGVLAHTLAGIQHLQAISGGLCDASDPDAVIERVVSFVCAGMRAPLPAALNRS